MARCPECGGEMVSHMKRKVCETCGLSLTGSEYDREWDKIRETQEESDQEKRRRQREYLDWLESKKK